MPPFVLAAMYGEGAKVLTDGVFVAPERLKAHGFTWSHPDLERAFAALYGA